MKKTKFGEAHWLIMAALGIALIVGHSLTQNILGKILAVGLVLTAAAGILSWWKGKSKSPEALTSLLGNGLILLVGLWILFNTQKFINLINIVVGLVILFAGAVNLYRSWKLGLKVHMALAVVAIVLGVVVLVYNAATALPIICQGVGLIYTAVVGFLADRARAGQPEEEEKEE